MTERIFKSYINKIPVGEYNVSDLYLLYKMICPKTYRNISKYENNMRFYEFADMFETKKYGLVYITKGKVEYIGTNDLNTLVVRA